MKAITLIIFIFFHYLTNSQVFHDGLIVRYDNCNPCDENFTTHTFLNPAKISSDFGPRYIRSGNNNERYDWHGGIDYNHHPVENGNDDFGFRIRSVEGGIIHEIERSNSGVIYIVIAGENYNMGYLHIFNHAPPPQTVNGFKYVYLDEPNMDLMGILAPDENGSYILLAACPAGDCTGLTYTENGTIYQATNEVGGDQLICPLGNSGSGGAHLHLSRYETLSGCSNFTNDDNCNIDPLEIISYFSPNYNIGIHNKSETNILDPANVPLGFSDENVAYITTPVSSNPNYPASKVMVRASLPGGGNGDTYSTATFDLREVNVDIKYELWNTFYNIYGGTYISRISLGSTENVSEEYPDHINASYTGQGWWTQQGIFPFAYRTGTDHGFEYNTTGGRPWDDYFFTDFITRIKKGDPGDGAPVHYARCPDEARYNDGEYEMKARAITVRDVEHVGPKNSQGEVIPESFVIDNWKPYIKKVKMIWGLETIYLANWECTGNGCIKFNQNNISSLVIPHPTTNVIIDVTASEPLDYLSLSVLSWNSTYSVSEERVESGFKVYRFLVPGAQFVNSFNSNVTLSFYGFDKATNQVLGFNSTMDLMCYELPYNSSEGFQNPEGGSIPSGFDNLHTFKINDCALTPSEMPGIGFEYYDLNIYKDVTGTFSEMCDDGSIDLTISEGVSPYIAQWYKWNGNDFIEYGGIVSSSGNSGIEDLYNLPIGLYKIKVRDQLCGVWEETIPITTEEKVSFVSINGNSDCPYSNGRYTPACDGSIDADIEGLGSYSILWTGPNGFSSNQLDIDNLAPGNYTLTVTKGLGQDCIFSKQIEICCCEIMDPVRSAGERSLCPPLSNVEVCNGQYDPNFSISAGNWGPVTNRQTCNGFITPLYSGDLEGVHFSWRFPDGTYSNSQYLLDICKPGRYCLTLSNSCATTFKCWDIIDCSVNPIIIDSEIGPNCGEEAQGFINLTVTGGVEPYAYKWTNNISTSNSVSDLLPGQYCVTITDNIDCRETKCFTIENIETTPFEIHGEVLPGAPGQGAINLTGIGLESATYEWSNGASTKNLTHLHNGAYVVTVSRQDGCKIIESFNLINLQCDAGGDLYLELPSDTEGSPCSGNGNINNIDFGGSIPPYTLTLSKEITSTSPDPFLFSEVYSEEQIDLDIIDIPRGRYSIRLQNGCFTEEKTAIYDMCEHCGWIYNEHEERFELWSGKVFLELKCLCEVDCGFLWFFTEAQIRFKKGDNSSWNGTPYVVEWPDDNSAHLQFNTTHSEWEIAGEDKYPLSDPDVDGVPFSLYMSKYPDCRDTITVIWDGPSQQVIIFKHEALSLCNNVLSNGHTICDYYWSNYPCPDCDPAGAHYSTNEFECPFNFEFVPTRFEFKPIDDENPCEGGGTMSGWVIENNLPVEIEIPIPPGIPFTEVYDDWVGAISPNEECSDGGGCIFSSLDIPSFNISLDKMILAQYCLSGIIQSEEDCDGDGQSNSVDPCPCQLSNECVFDDDDDNNEYDGPLFDPESGCEEDFIPEECLWVQDCPDEDPVIIYGEVNFEAMSGIDETDNCVYCFEAEICRVETPTETFEYIYSHVNYLDWDIEYGQCMNSPNDCYITYYCNIPGNPPVELYSGCQPNCNLNPYQCDIDSGDYGNTVVSPDDEGASRRISATTTDLDKAYKLLASKYDPQLVRYLPGGGIGIRKMNDKNKNEFIIFPNPASDEINIRCTNALNQEYRIEIIDIFGHFLHSSFVNFSLQNKVNINCDDMSNGVYFIHIIGNGITEYEQKFILLK